jgi:hypothetical protein
MTVATDTRTIRVKPGRATHHIQTISSKEMLKSSLIGSRTKITIEDQQVEILKKVVC